MKLDDLVKRMIRSVIVIALLSILGSIIYYRSLEFLPFFFGVLLGAITSIIKILLIQRTVDRAISMEKKQAKKHVGVQQLFRFLLSALVLIIGALVPQVSLWGVVVGIVAFHPSVYIANYKMKKTDTKIPEEEFQKTESSDDQVLENFQENISQSEKLEDKEDLEKMKAEIESLKSEIEDLKSENK